MSTQIEVAMEKMVFRKTNGQTGRHLAVTPENSTMRHLCYGRMATARLGCFVYQGMPP